MITVGTVLVACVGVVTVCAVLAVKELMEIRADTIFSWQMQKEIYFELKKLNKHFEDEKAEQNLTQDAMLKFYKIWDAEGVPSNREENV